MEWHVILLLRQDVKISFGCAITFLRAQLKHCVQQIGCWSTFIAIFLTDYTGKFVFSFSLTCFLLGACFHFCHCFSDNICKVNFIFICFRCFQIMLTIAGKGIYAPIIVQCHLCLDMLKKKHKGDTKGYKDR